VAPLRATYRLQLGADMTFARAAELVPYLRDLGVSHLYLSPAFAARAGSTHGYDVIDPTRLSDALGGEDGFRALAGTARAAGLGIVLDIVPNHMATDDANPYWSDPERRRAFFDIDPVTARHRRFFDIDDLAGVRQEDPEVFAETHRLALALVREGLVDGLRVDHPDGLADPERYLQRLRDGGAERVWVEKILDPGEPLRDWPVEGTVGYEFLGDVSALFVDPAGEAPLTALWEELSRDARPFGEWAAEAKLEQARTTFAPDVEWLRRLWPAADALEEALAALPVYRTYIRDLPAPEDLRVLREAGLVEWLGCAPHDFVTRFQQTTPPVMAKGVEDTAFYRYVRLLALNDVGADPSRFTIGVDAFHAANVERAERFPRGLLITQTHDTKRSGDVRARIGALAGMAEEWAAQVRRWRELCAPLRDGGAPDPIEEYTIFQTLAGAWPLEPERLCTYMEKALREAKRNTSWVAQDAAWEGRVLAYCRALYARAPFRDAFEPFAERLAAVGERHALRQTALKLTVPGVPDVYQGDELVALSLVDPDNRRPVDWARRRTLLDELRAGAPPAGADARKLFLIRELLALRARRPAPFAGGYTPLDAGPDAVAFLRGDEIAVAMPVREGGLDTLGPGLPRGMWRPAFDADLLPGAQINVLERA
jgi:(1->4)-alpha-D-glucan 1-alpha-D-glucosylmutase